MSELNSKVNKGKVIPFLQDGSFFYKKGIEAYQNGHLEQAIIHIERAIRIEPEEPVFYCQLAIVLADKGEYEQANQWLDKILKEMDDSMSEVYFFMANNLAHIGNLESAKLHLKQYLEMDPDGEFAEDAESFLMMLDEDGVLYEGFKACEPTPTEAIVDHLNKGNFQWAEKEARGYLIEHPKEWDIYAYLAESLMGQGEMEQAKSILKDLLIKESNFLAQCNMTLLLAKEGHKDNQIWVNNLKDLRPMKDWHCYYLAKTLFFLGEYERSYRWFRKLSRGSDFRKLPAYYHQMAIVAWKTGNETKARELFERTEQLDRENVWISQYYLDKLSNAAVGYTPEDDWFIYSQPGELTTNK
ncbi:MAG: tetratricopeptide repeat protein [Bacillus sp. (in: Bacteria)]|nr:tetratricopeptide repeat protein [Bacillus sp. (in: firmicutes)]